MKNRRVICQVDRHDNREDWECGKCGQTISSRYSAREFVHRHLGSWSGACGWIGLCWACVGALPTEFREDCETCQDHALELSDAVWKAQHPESEVSS